MANVYDIAKYIINFTITELEKPISNLKLQKILYYVQGLPGELKKLIKRVSKKCSTISAFTLVNKTHSEAPWSNTKQNDIISNAIMSDYFNLHDPLNIGDE